MSNIIYPIDLKFQVTTLANDFIATNANGEVIAYVREKLLKLVDEIDIYENDSRSNIIYKIKADSWLDFNSNYAFYNSNEQILGSLARKGWASLWSATYESYDANRNIAYTIKEENPFVKILDGLFGEIPIVGFLVGYVFNPKYIVKDNMGQIVARFIKIPSFFGRKFKIETYDVFNTSDNELLFLSLTELALQERRRG